MKVEEDSDSSSLPSLEDEEEQEKSKKEVKQKSVTKKKHSEERENTPRGKARTHKRLCTPCFKQLNIVKYKSQYKCQ